jgi:two-component system chemotaxis response regulator CheB
LAVVCAFSCLRRFVARYGGDGDGATGLRAVKDAGGLTIAQDEASSEAFSMPRTAIKTGGVDYILPLKDIAPMLVSLVKAG